MQRSVNVIYVVCRLSVCVWRECIVRKKLQLRSCGFHENVTQCLNNLPATFDDEILWSTWEYKEGKGRRGGEGREKGWEEKKKDKEEGRGDDPFFFEFSID